MAISLSNHDVACLAALQGELLSPLDHENTTAWCMAVLRRTEALFQGDRSAMLVPLSGGELHYVSESIAPEMAAQFREVLAPPDPGALRFKSAPEDTAWGARRAQQLEVWNIPMLAKLTGRPLDALPAYHDYILPSGITHGPVATTALPSGESFLGVANAERKDARFNGDSGLSLMRLVLPVFKAGVMMFERLNQSRAVLIRIFDELEQALLVVDLAGRPLHLTRQLSALLQNDPEGPLLHRAMMKMGMAIARRHAQHRVTLVDNSDVLQHVATRSGRYEMHSSHAGPGVFGPDGVVLVAIVRLNPVLPPVSALMGRHQMTRREAQIALCLAEGLSNTAVAARLGISRHTVRHHSESVFLKLNIHSRKALALTLLGDGRSPLLP
jgi:DNA-binding CsgD family transcriptional regulator